MTAPAFSETGVVSGQRSGWSLIKKLGEGDAGEVYLVESLVEKTQAILKRPRRTVFAHETHRQAEQIRTEGRILHALESLLGGLSARPVRAPALLDSSKPGNEFSERYFIVIERAAGFDLNLLARTARMGMPDNGEADAQLSPLQRAFLGRIAREGVIPERLLLAVLAALLDSFAAIHAARIQDNGLDTYGIVWNDVKPDHLFWDPALSAVMIIDWGNGRFIEQDGTTRDLRLSPGDDYRQFIEELGRFLIQSSPELHARLGWPERPPLASEAAPLIEMLRERISTRLGEQQRALDAARSEEQRLLQPGLDASAGIGQLEAVQTRILDLGELPDFGGALRMAGGMAANLAAAGNLEGVRALCAWAGRLPDADPADWVLLDRLAAVTASAPEGDARRRFSEAMQSAVAGDWEGTLWGMVAGLQNEPEPEWWHEILSLVRRRKIGAEADSARPLMTLRRTAMNLTAQAQMLEDKLARSPEADGQARVDALRATAARLREVVLNWIQVEPLPPYTDLLYSDLDLRLNELDDLLPGAAVEMDRALTRARERVQTILDAWNHKDFLAAGRGLRALLMWDPDRRRLLRADLSVQAAGDWLARAHLGPGPDESLNEYLTSLEYEGREIRNQVGPAGWLDLVLDALKHMRRGGWPGDLLAQRPALLAELPWLRRFERAEKVERLFKTPTRAYDPAFIRGSRETHFGVDGQIAFIEPLDAWIPEARGSSARVYLASYRSGLGDLREGALKLMRTDKAAYSLPLFREEVQVLSVMNDVPGVNRLVECGFLFFSESTPALPPDHNLAAVRELRGDALRIGPDSIEQFFSLLERRTEEGWTPYVLVEKQRREDNLLLLCDAGLNQGRLLPVGKLLLMAVQICDVLEEAHRRNVVYRDHKILHYYWQEDLNGVFFIDWNVARYHPDGLSEYDIHMDLVQLGARGLHHILTGRTAPGALPLGPTRPEEIEAAAASYQAQWTYDDRRLTVEVRSILEQLLSGGYRAVADLRDDLKRAAMNLD